MKVISFSLWGNDEKYRKGALRNVILAKEIYPDWECWVYCGFEIPNSCKQALEDLGAHVISKLTSMWNGLFWRFLPMSASNVDVCIVRDTDSRLDWREKAAVDEWLASDYDVHAMRDHPHHDVPILGGMWGCRNRILRNIEGMILSWDMFDRKGIDQDFLAKIVWPLIKSRCLVHDDAKRVTGDERPFPAHKQCQYSSFVGEIVE